MSHPKNANLSINQFGIDLIKKWEGYHRRLPDGRCQAYLDKLAARKYWTPGYKGLLTIGWGCTEGVTEGMIWTEQQAHDYLMLEVRKHENYVKDMVTVPVNPNQFSALVSLSYNMGPANLRKSSLLRKLNDGDYAGATEDFNRYTRAGGKVYKGLVSRRKEEQRLFSKLPRKELIKKSRKLTLIERLRLLIPVGGVGTWFSFENLDSVRQFMTDYSGFIVLFAGFSVWAVLRLIESYSMEDYAEGRYVPSGATDAE